MKKGKRINGGYHFLFSKKILGKETFSLSFKHIEQQTERRKEEERKEKRKEAGMKSKELRELKTKG